MKTLLTFSIITPTYNRRKLLQRAVESVLNQTHNDWELIIIDDGSSDDTKQYVSTINDNRVKYHYQINKGRNVARNKGIELSSGKFIIFLDSDDELLNNYLDISIKVIDSHKVYCSGVQLKSNRKITNIIPNTNYEKFIIQFLEGNFNLMPFLFDRKIFSKYQLEDSAYYGEDYKFLLPIIVNEDIVINETLCSIVHDHKDRTIKTSIQNIKTTHQELINNILEPLIQYKTVLENTIGSTTFEKIYNEKINSFILSAAQINHRTTSQIVKKYKYKISFLLLFKQRIKGIIKNIYLSNAK